MTTNKYFNVTLQKKQEIYDDCSMYNTAYSIVRRQENFVARLGSTTAKIIKLVKKGFTTAVGNYMLHKNCNIINC